MTTKSILITKNGPYLVAREISLNQATIACNSDGESETWRKGKAYDTGNRETYALCRCGHSHKKPFCDGAHLAVGFQGRERADRPAYADRARRFEGPDLDLLDDKNLCVGARFCDKDGTVWKMIRRTDDPRVRDLAIKAACDCPGGRLTAVTKDGDPIEPELAREISLVEDPENNFRGPLWAQGGIAIEGADGERYEVRNRVALCRCGESRNMPYCDISHMRCPHMQGFDR